MAIKMLGLSIVSKEILSLSCLTKLPYEITAKETFSVFGSVDL